jgi:hypothetical protein
MASDFATGMIVGALAVVFPRIPELVTRAVQACMRSLARSVAYGSLALLDKLDADLREADSSVEQNYQSYMRVTSAIPVASWRQEEIDFEENAEQSRADDESDGDSSDAEPVEEHGAAHDDSTSTE